MIFLLTKIKNEVRLPLCRPLCFLCTLLYSLCSPLAHALLLRRPPFGSFLLPLCSLAKRVLFPVLNSKRQLLISGLGWDLVYDKRSAVSYDVLGTLCLGWPMHTFTQGFRKVKEYVERSGSPVFLMEVAELSYLVLIRLRLQIRLLAVISYVLLKTLKKEWDCRLRLWGGSF